MLFLCKKMEVTMEQILNYLTYRIKEQISQYLNDNVEEIRLRVGRPIAIKYENNIKITTYIITTEEILEVFEKICENSVYSYKQ